MNTQPSHTSPQDRRFVGGGHAPHRPSLEHIAYAWLGSLISLGLIALFAERHDQTILFASFGASCVLVFGFPKSPLAQPRNLIGGYLLATLLGLLCLWLFGAQWWSTTLGLATLIALMLYTRTGHPPAGACLMIVMSSDPSWRFLLDPTLIGAGIILAVGLVINNIGKGRSYPMYWLG